MYTLWNVLATPIVIFWCNLIPFTPNFFAIVSIQAVYRMKVFLALCCSVWQLGIVLNQPLTINHMKIKTNNNYRPIIFWNELTESEKSEFADLYDDVEESSFFRFKGEVYDLSDFLRVEGETHELYGWDGYKNETFFSSILVKLSQDNEFLKVGRAIS